MWPPVDVILVIVNLLPSLFKTSVDSLCARSFAKCHVIRGAGFQIYRHHGSMDIEMRVKRRGVQYLHTSLEGVPKDSKLMVRV